MALIKNNKFYAFLSLLLIVCIIMFSAPIPVLIQMIIDNVLPKHNKEQLLYISMIFVFLVLGQILFNFILSYVSSKWVQEIIYKLRLNLYKDNLKNNKYNNRKSNSMLQTIIISDTEVIGTNFQRLFIEGMNAIVSVITYLVFIYLLDSRLLIMIIFSIPLFILLNVRLSNISKEKFEEVQRTKDSLNNYLNDIFEGFNFIKVYRIQKEIINDYSKLINNMKNINVNFSMVMIFLGSVVTTIAVTIPFIVLIYGCYMVFEGKQTIGIVIADYTYSSAIFSPISVIIGLMPIYKQLTLSLERLAQFSKDTVGVGLSNDSVTINNNYRDTLLELDKVYIKYPKSDFCVKNMTLKLKKNHIYLLEGKNGSGKTTLLKAIFGMLPITIGNIIKKEDLKIEFVLSENYLFKSSILNNIIMGLDSYDNENLKYLVKVFRLDKDLRKNRQSLNDVVNNSDKCLSNGEIQKMKLMRAILAKPDILLIDECLSNIDEQSQNNILEYLKKWSKDRIIVIISHENLKIKEKLSPEIIKM